MHARNAVLRALGLGCVAAIVCVFALTVLKAGPPWAVLIGVLTAAAFSFFLTRKKSN
jgi:LPXTG-motif cell wall-anchored protein